MAPNSRPGAGWPQLAPRGRMAPTHAPGPDGPNSRPGAGWPQLAPRGRMAPSRIVAADPRAYTAAMTDEPAAGTPQAPPADPNADCPHCRKPKALCVCEGIARIDNKVSLLILQHPQEQDRELGTARLTALHF